MASPAAVPGGRLRTLPPPTNLAWSLLALIGCVVVVPLAVVAVAYSAVVRRRWRLGNPGAAVRAARTSAVWSLLAAATTVTLLASWSRLVPVLDRPAAPVVILLVVLSAVVAVGSVATLLRLRGRVRA